MKKQTACNLSLKTTSTSPDMDNLTYNYYTGTNQLRQVNDPISSSNYSNDIDDQSYPLNYVYDNIGNLIKDASTGITLIDWSISGKIRSIEKNSVVSLVFEYDALGNRIKKVFTSNNANSTEYYVRDAQGNIMATYTNNGSGVKVDFDIYGSSRLGLIHNDFMTDIVETAIDENSQTISYHNISKTLGNKEYELTNHLGNVQVTISDRSLSVPEIGFSTISYYEADVLTAVDYYPGGFSLPGRSFSINSYPFGYQGSQKDNEIYGDGNAYTTYFRELDVRLGRWFTIDPKSAATPWESPYVSMGDNPIVNNDPNGDLFGTRWGSTSAQRKAARTEANKTKSKIHHFLKKDIHVDYHAGKKDYDIDIMTDINGQQVVARSLIIRPEDQYFLPNGDKVTHDDQKLYSSEHSLDAWFNKKIGGNDNIEYKGYAATELTPKQGSKVLGALGCVAGGTGFVVDGGIIAYSLLFASVTTTSNDLSRGKDDRGFIEKSINNPTGENVYKKIEMVLNIYGVASGTMDAFKSTGAVSKGLSTASAIYGIPGLPLPKK